MDESRQQQENNRIVRNARKKRKAEENKKVKEKIEGKIGKKIVGPVIKKWLYYLMLSVIGFLPAVFLFDIYAFITIFTKKFGELKYLEWVILATINIFLFIILKICFEIFLCISNPVLCGLDYAKDYAKDTALDAVKGVVE